MPAIYGSRISIHIDRACDTLVKTDHAGAATFIRTPETNGGRVFDYEHALSFYVVRYSGENGA